jgi:hypothetical protein
MYICVFKCVYLCVMYDAKIPNVTGAPTFSALMMSAAFFA